MFKKSRLAIFALTFLLLSAVLYIGAQPAFAAGEQSGDRVCTGDNLTIAAGQTSGNILALGCNVDVQQGATVNGSIADFGGNIRVAGTVNGTITTFGGNVMLTETAVVTGQVASMGGNYSSAPGAIAPPIPPVPPAPFNPFTRMFNFGFDLLGGIVTALAFAALGALVVIFAPNATRRVSDAVQNKPLNIAGIGCLTLIVLPILAILLIITIIGIPIAFILGFVAWAAWIFGGIAIGLLAGEKILGAFKMTNILPVLAVVLGVVLLMLVGQIPVFGWLVSCVVGLLGLGAVVMTRFGTRAYPPVPGMALATVAASPGSPAVQGTFTPTAVDTALWEEKARQAQAQGAAPASDVAAAASDIAQPGPPTAGEPGAAEPKPADPPAESGETKPDA